MMPPCSVASRCCTAFRPLGAFGDLDPTCARRQGTRPCCRQPADLEDRQVENTGRWLAGVGASRSERCRNPLASCTRHSLLPVREPQMCMTFASVRRHCSIVPETVHLTTRSGHERTRDRRDGDAHSRWHWADRDPVDRRQRSSRTRAVRGQAAVSGNSCRSIAGRPSRRTTRAALAGRMDRRASTFSKPTVQ